MAWLAFIPLLALPTPQSRWERLGVGMLFGYAHFATALHWLNTVGFGAGWMLAIYCALYPTIWYYHGKSFPKPKVKISLRHRIVLMRPFGIFRATALP